MHLSQPITRDIVLVGGGHTHALVLRMWGMDPVPGVRLTLINPAPVAAYSGMLPGLIAGHYRREALEIDLVKLARFAGPRLVLGRAEGIDRDRRRVKVHGRADIAYDILSIDIGVTSDMPALPGFDEHGVPAKPLDGLADRWERFCTEVAEGRTEPQVAVIGGGLAGCELALAAAHRLGRSGRVSLIEADRALAAVGRGARNALRAHLRRAGVVLLEQSPAVAAEAGGVALADGRRIAAGFIIGAAGTVAQGWLAGTGLALEQGFIRVGPTLQSETDPLILAAGDVAHLTHAPRPKAGVFAVRQAPVLLHNLRLLAAGTGSLRTYRPQRDYLKLVSTGGRGAVADKWGLRLDGAPLWAWKDRIDRRFMARFHDLPVMDAVPSRSGDQEGARPLCGGCGAKAGRAPLERALARLPAPSRADVVAGTGDDAAVLRSGGGYQVLTTDHLRAFTSDPWVMARVAAIHALGDVWSMGARPQVALAQIIMPPMDEDRQAETLREIMEAAQGIFGPEGADIVGGHTSLGAELTVGFTVTGLTGRAVTHGGARPGDALILTKPVGSGIILAAEMEGRAPGRVVSGALASMLTPQGTAAALLAPVAHAMTDVTGFGLAGHLFSILDASGLAARLDGAAIPLLAGAADLARAGQATSLLAANWAVRVRMILTDAPENELLFDPQTAGGLLAAVGADAAPGLVRALRDLGYRAAVIGHLSEGAPLIALEGQLGGPAA
jgi:selenide,water dikinase